jgi:hypothetical protein
LKKNRTLFFLISFHIILILFFSLCGLLQRVCPESATLVCLNRHPTAVLFLNVTYFPLHPEVLPSPLRSLSLNPLFTRTSSTLLSYNFWCCGSSCGGLCGCLEFLSLVCMRTNRPDLCVRARRHPKVFPPLFSYCIFFLSCAG